MATPRNEGFQILAREPIDSRQVVNTAGDLASIPLVYDGLMVYVDDEERYYSLISGVWEPFVWTGSDYDDDWIQPAIDLKVDKSGDTMTGSLILTGTSTVSATNFILSGSTSSFGTPLPYEPGITEVLWGDIIGDILNQGDLQDELNAKMDADTATFTVPITAPNFILSASSSSEEGSGSYQGWTVWVDNDEKEKIASNDRIDFVGGTNVTLAWVNNELTINSSGGGGGDGDVTEEDLDLKYDKVGGLVSGTVIVTEQVNAGGVMTGDNFIMNGSEASFGMGSQVASYTDNLVQLNTQRTAGIMVIRSTGLTSVQVQTNATAEIPVGSRVRVVNLGDALTTIIADSGVNVRTRLSSLSIATEETRLLLKVETDEWILTH